MSGAADEQDLSPRVNAARLGNYISKTVRLPCKVLKIDDPVMKVEASDGGQVVVKIAPNTCVSDTYIEVVGRVEDPTTIKMMVCIGLGSDLDMKLVNDTVELIHDPRFSRMFH